MPAVGGLPRLWLLIASIGLLLVVGALLWALALVDPVVGSLRGIGDDRPRLNLLRTAQLEDLQANLALKSALSVAEGAQKNEERRDFQLHRQHASDALAELQTIGVSEDVQSRLDAVMDAHKGLEQSRKAVIDNWQSGHEHSASRDSDIWAVQAAEHRYVNAVEILRATGKTKVDAYLSLTSANTKRIRALITFAGAVGGCTSIMLGAVWVFFLRIELNKRESRIAQLRQQRSALVRDVHHRIRNHLQDSLGFLEGCGMANAAESEAIATLKSQVLALIGLHEQQATQADESVMTLELLRSQVQMIEAVFSKSQISLLVDQNCEGLSLDGERAVTLALTVTELLVNALKHGVEEPVVVRLQNKDHGTLISITNHLLDVTKLDWNAGTGLGTGLALLTSLSRDLGHITQEIAEGKITMAINLSPAVEA